MQSEGIPKLHLRLSGKSVYLLLLFKLYTDRVWEVLMNCRAMVAVILVSLFLASLLNSEEFELKNAFPNLTFANPVDLQHAGDDTDRIFVVSQNGRIYVFENRPEVEEAGLFLDISDRVEFGGERGLLGLAFHPDFKNNGYFFVYYTAPNPLRSVIARFTVSESDPNRADAMGEAIILEFNQPRVNHNGGQIAFGPDGYLYIASGDGGGSGDPGNNAQNRRNLLGAILRLDVDTTQGDLNYSVPDDNPFTGNTEGYREEIYAFGLRNPWRMSFDIETGWLWCGDVGQSSWEIIHLIENGKNYGWNIIEGSHCYPPETECDKTGLELPIYEYKWGEDGRSITGGYVYRGSALPDLYGMYIYGDYLFGTVWALEYDGESEPVNSKLIDSGFLISSFGTDEAGEIYILRYAGNGGIYKFDTATQVDNDRLYPRDFSLYQNYPNPFNNETVISFSIPHSAHVTIEIYNLLGQKIENITDRYYEVGTHTVVWNAANAGSGIYYYRIQVGDYVRTRRMILLQ
jgi:glucose/arabinose dehydrogenase